MLPLSVFSRRSRVRPAIAIATAGQASLDLETERFHEPAPFHGFCLDELRKLLRTVADRLGAQPDQPLPHVRQIEDSNDLAIELNHYCLGRSSGRRETEPADGLVPRQARFGNSGEFWQLRRALRSRYRKRPQLAGLDLGQR